MWLALIPNFFPVYSVAGFPPLVSAAHPDQGWISFCYLGTDLLCADPSRRARGYTISLDWTAARVSFRDGCWSTLGHCEMPVRHPDAEGEGAFDVGLEFRGDRHKHADRQEEAPTHV